MAQFVKNGDKPVESTIAVYYNELMADFKNNEVAIFKKLQRLEGAAAKGASDAATEADAVRQWVRELKINDNRKTTCGTTKKFRQSIRLTSTLV
jgi:hypothetical protein